MATQDLEADREATNPLFNDRKLKLGTFGTNLSGACAISTIDGVFETTWPNTLALAKLADEMEFEALVPVGRWRGFGGETNFNGSSFETYTWAAGIGAVTRNSTVFATSHVPTVHPIMAAKQATTIDHITGGRFALNIVCGWFEPEFEMFGSPIMDHETRYDYAAEWINIIKRLWTEEDEFDFEGKYFTIKKGFHQPKPVQKPFPAVMNAGGSERGMHFAAKHCDICFIALKGHGTDEARALVESYRRLAREEYGREIQIWNSAYVVQRETEKEARDYLDYYVREKGDWVAVDNLAKTMGVHTQTRTPENLEQFKFHFIAGWGGYPLVGTKDQIVSGLETLSEIGLDGTVLSWAEFEDGMRQFQTEALPLVRQAGLR